MALRRTRLNPCWGSALGFALPLAIAPSLLWAAMAIAQTTPDLPGVSPSIPQTDVVRPLLPPPGLCDLGQQDRSGRWINDGTGELVPLVTACDVANQVDEPAALSPETTRFWTAFVNAASPEAIAFAESLETEAVVAYGKTICAALLGGESLAAIRVIQQDGGLPPAFDAAVNVAAIHTYCPAYTGTIGR